MLLWILLYCYVPISNCKLFNTNETLECTDQNCSLTCNTNNCNDQYLVGFSNISCTESNSCRNMEVICPDNGCWINCIADSSCINMMVFCPKTTCNIFCDSWYSCSDSTIIANNTQFFEMGCFFRRNCRNIDVHILSSQTARILCSASVPTWGDYAVCRDGNIHTTNIETLIIQCDGCNGININTHNVSSMSFSSQPIGTDWEPHIGYYPSLLNSIVNATNTNTLVVNCMGISSYRTFGSHGWGMYSSYACIGNSFYTSPDTSIHCNSYGCRDNSLYISNDITMTVSVTVDYCDRCNWSKTDCAFSLEEDPKWYLYCNGIDDGYSIFYIDEEICANETCCYDGLFNIMDTYDQCSNNELMPRTVVMSIRIIQFIICIISIVMLIRIGMYWIMHKRDTKLFRLYNIPFRKPYFILDTVNLANILFHFIIWFGVFYIAILHRNIFNYCRNKYSLETTALLCDTDMYCMCYDEDYCEISCGADSTFLALDVVYYILFAFYCCIECSGYYHYKERGKFVTDDYICCVYTFRYYGNKQNNVFDDGDMFKCRMSVSMYMIIRYILLCILTITNIILGYNVELCLLLPAIIVIILGEIVKIYYVCLPDYYETHSITLWVWHYFDKHIGNIILEYLGLTKTNSAHPKTNTSLELHSILRN